MISFLIPIYNRNVTKLVRELYDQGRKLDIEFEILCYDDLSKDKYKAINSKLGGEVGISYIELSKKLGRSKTRNWLGKNARYEHLVFLDCDQYINRKTFVQKYFNAIGKADLVYGGTSYKKSKPGKSVRLHWKYGSKAETQSVSLRNKHPYRNFRSNNFLISRTIFLQHTFDENKAGYGYEDSLIVHKFKENQRSILHIDNPVEHAGLEKTDVFLNKTENAIKNLVFQHNESSISNRLTESYEKYAAWGLLPFITKLNGLFHESIYKKLYKENPPLWAFQWFKLHKYIEEMNRYNKV